MEMEYYKEIWTALKREFSRFRLACALVFSLVVIGVVCAGIFWPKAYESNALVYIDSANVIEPLMDSNRRITNEDRAELAKKLLYTRNHLQSTAQAAGMLPEDATPEQINETVTNLRQSITIDAEGENYFRVTYWSSSPERSYKVVDSLINTFIGSRAAAKQSTSNEAYNFINSQVQVYKKRLDEAEQKLQLAKAENPNITEAMVDARIAELNAQIQEVKLAIQGTESRIATTRQLLNEEDQLMSQQSEVMALQERHRALQTELNQLRLAYQESYPDIVSIKEQLREVEAALAAKGAQPGYGGAGGEALYGDLRKQVSVAEVELKAQRSQLTSLERSLEEQIQRADEVAQHSAKLDELTRDYNVLLNVYEKLLSRQENAKFSVALNLTQGGDGYQIIEQPVFPLEPGGPQFVHFALAAPILGLGAPIGLMLVLIMADPRIRSTTRLMQSIPADLEIMGVVPHFDSPAEKRAARGEIAMLILFCGVVMVGYGFLVYAGINGIV